MKKWKYVVLGASLLLGACQPMGMKGGDTMKNSTDMTMKDKKEETKAMTTSAKSVDASFKTFDGKDVKLSDYKGKKIYNSNPSLYTNYGILNAGYILSIIGTVLGGLSLLYWIIVVGVVGIAATASQFVN